MTTPTDLTVGGLGGNPPNMCLGITHEEKMPTQAKPMPYMGSRGQKCTKNRPTPKNSDFWAKKAVLTKPRGKNCLDVASYNSRQGCSGQRSVRECRSAQK